MIFLSSMVIEFLLVTVTFFPGLLFINIEQKEFKYISIPTYLLGIPLFGFINYLIYSQIIFFKKEFEK